MGIYTKLTVCPVAAQFHLYSTSQELTLKFLQLKRGTETSGTHLGPISLMGQALKNFCFLFNQSTPSGPHGHQLALSWFLFSIPGIIRIRT